MPTYRSSVSIEASPEVVFAHVSDVRRLARCRHLIAEPGSGEAVAVTGTGEPGTVQAWFRVHEGHRKRVEWGADAAKYRGWLEVDPEGEVASVTAEIHTHTTEGVDAALDSALFALKAEIEACEPGGVVEA